MITEFCLKIQSVAKQKSTGLNYGALKQRDVKQQFVELVANTFPHDACSHVDGCIDDVYANIVQSVSDAAIATIPALTHVAKRPWISNHTLGIIQKRHEARVFKNWSGEAHLHKQVKASAKRDRANWLQHLAGSGSWRDLKKLRERCSPQQGLS